MYKVRMAVPPCAGGKAPQALGRGQPGTGHAAGLQPVLIISGQYNPIVPARNSAQLATVLVNTLIVDMPR